MIARRWLSANLWKWMLPACLLSAATGFSQQPVKYDAGAISGLPIRNIGSATMSGRIAALTAVNDNGRLTVFVGSASGGVWKSINGGTSFRPVFDTQGVQSIGAVTVDPANPKVVWVGSGETWVRNSVHRRGVGTKVRDGLSSPVRP